MRPERVETVCPTEMFWQIIAGHQQRPLQEITREFADRRILALDPGETTGVAIWNGANGSFELFQLETKEIGQSYDILHALVQSEKPDHLRYEEYRIYNWMADSHSWSVLHTPQLIGAIRVVAHLLAIPISCKLAQQAKAVFNDNVLKMCDLYEPGLKHARDASRHLFYYMALPDKED